MRRTLPTLLAALFLVGTAAAQTAGDCPRSLGEAYLDINNVRARILNTGGLFWRGAPHVYEVPRGSGSNSVFAASIWLAGMQGGELKAAATRYGEWEFWAGPIDDKGQPPADCSVYDRLYRIDVYDLERFEETGEATTDLRDWPTGLGAPTLDAEGNLIDVMSGAFLDRQDRVIDLAGGERPAIVGHQMIWWVMNDQGNGHQSTGTRDNPGKPIGVEAHATAFAYLDDSPLMSTTFYRYTLYARDGPGLEDAYFGVFIDPDLGDFADDYVGSDSVLGLAYTYNSDNEDISKEGYGDRPPALGYDFVRGPLVEGGSGAVFRGAEVAGYQHTPMRGMLFYNGGGGVSGDPEGGEDYYLYMQQRWKDGKPLTVGGNGRDFGSTPTTWMFSGNPVTGEFWSEINSDSLGNSIDPADRRYVASAGPFELTPDRPQEITFAMLWAQGSDHLDSVIELKAASQRVQEMVDYGLLEEGIALAPPPEGLVAPDLIAPGNGVAGVTPDAVLVWEPIAGADSYEVRVFEVGERETQVVGRFSDTPRFRLTGREFELEKHRTYRWQVAPVRDFLRGPASSYTFYTGATRSQGAGVRDFQVVANASGTIDPPDCGAFGFNGSGMPLIACGSDRPVRGSQQSTNNSAWGISTAMSSGCSGPCGSFDSFSFRSLRQGIEVLGTYLYEMRFEGAGGVAMRAFGDETTLAVPFTLWRSSPETPNNRTDDVQMIAVVCDTDTCGGGRQHGTFDIGGEHDASGGDNDPFSDWIYWYLPDDTSAGSSGHDAYFDDPVELGQEIFARMVLVNWNGGAEPPYTSEMPEEGTVFRIVTGSRQQFRLLAPALGTVQATSEVTFVWGSLAGPLAPDSARIQVATDAEFDGLLIDARIPEVLEWRAPSQGRYHWRVGGEGSDWAGPWFFEIDDEEISPEFMALRLSAEGRSRSLRVGFAPGATARFDPGLDLEAEAPPLAREDSLGQFVGAALLAMDGQRLSSDVRPEAATTIWTLDLEAPSQGGVLSWSSPRWNGWTTLRHPDTGLQVSIQDNRQVAVPPGRSSWEISHTGFAIGTEDEVPSRPTLELYPLPASESVTLRWSGAPVRADLYDLLGRRVATIELTAGTRVMPLTGLASGLYFLFVDAGTVAPVIVRR